MSTTILAPHQVMGKVAKSYASPAQSAAPAKLPDGITADLGRILRPQAAYRWMLPQLSAMTPQYIEATLRGALAGNHVQAWELFDLMLDSWPELAACTQEITDGVLLKQMIYEAAHGEDEQPSETALEKMKVVSAAIRGMSPEAAADENDIKGTLSDLVDGWFRGVTALEIDWQRINHVSLQEIMAPRSTFWVHPICYAFSAEGRLGLRSDAQGRLSPGPGTSYQPMPSQVVPFPPGKFLVGIHKAKAGTALGGAMLRPLAWWWCAANFSADWLLNLAQIFGLPFRWANYDANAAPATINSICNMLQNMGSAGWAAFPAGTTLELKDAGKTGDHSPQGELLDRADRYARLLILGQTMSGSQNASKGGGKAFGAVEKDVKANRIEAAGMYACQVLNTQLIPSIIRLNYGNEQECPTVRLLEEKEGGPEEATRDLTLSQAGLKIGVNYLRKKYGIPEPAEGEETIGGVPPANGPELPRLEDEDDDDDDGVQSRDAINAIEAISAIDDDRLFKTALDLYGSAIAAGDAPGHEFHGNQYSKAGESIKPEDYRTAPARITPQEAVKRLETGFEHPGYDGRKYKFGKNLLDKFASKSDGDFRLRHLPHAQETLTQPFHVEHQGGQDMHIGLFKQGDKELHTFVFTGKGGEVTNVTGYYLPRRAQVEKELAKGRKGK